MCGKTGLGDDQLSVCLPTRNDRTKSVFRQTFALPPLHGVLRDICVRRLAQGLQPSEGGSLCFGAAHRERRAPLEPWKFRRSARLYPVT